MGRLIDLTGQRFGRWVVLGNAGRDKNGLTQWLCRCDCGNEVVVLGINLKKGRTQSCGCLQREQMVAKKTTHGLRFTRLYRIWSHIKDRCLRETCRNYKDYGGRGITICDKWLHDFQAFYDWAMSHGYRDDLTIDRINVDGNYCPENCRWVTMLTQAGNKQNTKYIEFNGETHTLKEWSAIVGIPRDKLYDRIYAKKWSIEKAFSKK